MSSNSLIKSTRQAIGGSSNSNGHNTGSAASTMSDATAQVIKRSKEQFITDMRRLLNEAKRHFGDVCWRLDGDDEVIYGHRGRWPPMTVDGLLFASLAEVDMEIPPCALKSHQLFYMRAQMQPFSPDSSIRMAVLVYKRLCLDPPSRFKRLRHRLLGQALPFLIRIRL